MAKLNFSYLILQEIRERKRDNYPLTMCLFTVKILRKGCVKSVTLNINMSCEWSFTFNLYLRSSPCLFQKMWSLSVSTRTKIQSDKVRVPLSYFTTVGDNFTEDNLFSWEIRLWLKISLELIALIALFVNNP